jgi:PIF1-like helicase
MKNVIYVASSGIAAILLKGGCTVHLCFKVPISLHEASFCTIFQNTKLAALIQQVDLVIWDEAPMQLHHVMKAVDRSFKDLCHSPDKPFGGLTIVFGGDFQQILPVILKGFRAQVVGTCMKISILWRHITVLHLHQNMHLNTHIAILKKWPTLQGVSWKWAMANTLMTPSTSFSQITFIVQRTLLIPLLTPSTRTPHSWPP